MQEFEVEREISGHLEVDEKLLWSGAPRGGIVFQKGDIFLIPFSLIWGGVFIYGMGGGIKFSNAPPIVPIIFVTLFILVGSYFIVGRFIVDAITRSKTAYGITDRRIIIIAGTFSRSIKSLQLRTLSDVTLDERANGEGTITFGPNPFSSMGKYSGLSNNNIKGAFQVPAFQMIPQARDVYRMIQEAI